jgi:tetratricopeptide (TPR) repeat protein
VTNHKSLGKAGFLQRERNNRPIGQNGAIPKMLSFGRDRHGMSDNNGLTIVTEEAMLPKIRFVPNLSKVLVAGLVLGVIPWVVSGYIFPQSSQSESNSQTASVSNDTEDLSLASKPAPLLIPIGEPVHRLQPLDEQAPMVLTSGFPADQTLSNRRVNNTSKDEISENNLSENSIPELGPALSSQNSPNDIPSPEIISAQTSSEMTYPSTDEPEGLSLPEETPLAEMTGPGLNAVPSPAASSNYGSVPSEAVYSRPAVQMTTMPNSPERMPADVELLHPSIEPQGSRSVQEVAMPVRSEQLESIARQADAEIRHGFELAGRGAYYAARSEFIAALRLVAQGLDTDRQTTIHGKSLAAGLTALREADEFIPRGSMVEANLDISALVASHTTPALKNADNSRTTSLLALKSYLTFAQEQFALASDREIAGSMALRALGKLHDELSKGQSADIQAAGPKAVVYYQAALLVSPQNYLAANDLGVMFARSGNLKDAQKILEHSAAVGRQSIVLNNLAAVYQKMGYYDLAGQAKQQSFLAQQAEQARKQSNRMLATNGSVEWVAPDAFGQTSPNLTVPPTIASNLTTPPRVSNTVRQAPPATNTFGSNNPHWLPNYQRPAANTNYPSTPQQPPVTGQTPRSDYQR